MSATALVLVGIAAMAGAWLRWLLGALLNAVYPTVPLGTLVANLLGSLLMGLAIVLLVERGALSPELRVAVITGFLGAFTTMSTFSAEAMTLIAGGSYLFAAVHIALHVAGSITMAFVGVMLARMLVGG